MKTVGHKITTGAVSIHYENKLYFAKYDYQLQAEKTPLSIV
jgi:hypothetical protein